MQDKRNTQREFLIQLMCHSVIGSVVGFSWSNLDMWCSSPFLRRKHRKEQKLLPKRGKGRSCRNLQETGCMRTVQKRNDTDKRLICSTYCSVHTYLVREMLWAVVSPGWSSSFALWVCWHLSFYKVCKIWLYNLTKCFFLGHCLFHIFSNHHVFNKI